MPCDAYACKIHALTLLWLLCSSRGTRQPTESIIRCSGAGEARADGRHNPGTHMPGLSPLSSTLGYCIALFFSDS